MKIGPQLTAAKDCELGCCGIGDQHRFPKRRVTRIYDVIHPHFHAVGELTSAVHPAQDPIIMILPHMLDALGGYSHALGRYSRSRQR